MNLNNMIVGTYLHKPSSMMECSPNIEYMENNRISYEQAMDLSDFENGTIETCFYTNDETSEFLAKCKEKNQKFSKAKIHGAGDNWWFDIGFEGQSEFEEIRDVICEVIDEINCYCEHY